jgi:FixJ family two-component response regulator
VEAALTQPEAIRMPTGSSFEDAAASDRPLIIVVDDDPDICDALYELLRSVDLDAVRFGSTQELLRAPLPERPGCFILDVRMPGLSGLELQSRLAGKGDGKPIIFLTGYGDVPMTVQAMKAGAVDFLIKPVRDQALLDAVATAIDVDRARRAGAALAARATEQFEALTRREQQVLRAAAAGMLNKQIAFELGISEVTVKLHRGSMMKKIGAKTIADLVRAWESLPAAARESVAS